jgi:inorganic triphosphatase YgiF
LVGQAVALREISWRLSLQPKGDTRTLAGWQALVWLLGEVTAAERTLLPVEGASLNAPEQSFGRVQQQADALARRTSAQPLARDATARLLRHLAGLDSAFNQSGAPTREVLFRRAERLTLALERLTNAALTPGGDVAPVAPELRMLRESLGSEANFDAGDFARQLVKLRTSLER